ncbi:MAG: BON domain-containing protein, partial [Chitinivibrionales bacterium]|nr:BON domain-containing protein [Chitinivibrionales bacterium]
GTVHTLSARRAAVRDARNTVGIMRVDNNLDVRITSRENERIEQDLERAFLWDPVLERHEVAPVVRNAKAYLYGRVDNAYEKWRAADVASRVPGVATVDNRLSVADEWQQRTDSEIEQAVEDELFWSSKVDEDNITVDVEEGIVTLAGAVGSWTEHHQAIDDAFEAGARVVRSELSVAGDEGAVQTYRYNQFQYRFPDGVYF